MKSLFLVGAFLLAFVALNVATEPQPKFQLTMDQTKEMCSKLKKSNSLFRTFRCMEEGEDLAKHGKTWKLKHPEVKADSLDPVVLIPGFGGSALEARLNKQDSPAWYCFKEYDWFHIWLALEELFVQDCWIDNLVMTYDPATNSYNNTYGVEVRGMDFGGVDGVSYVDWVLGIPVPFTSVFASLVSSLEEVGYEAGKNLRGIPYDFRLPPDAESNDLYATIKSLIEETYTNNGNKPVHVVSHSMGGPVFLYFMNTQDPSWVQTYIKSFIPIAGPWAGSPKALRTLISGDNFGIEFLGLSIANKLKFRTVGRSTGGLTMLIPDKSFWEDQIFVYTQNKNYTADDLGQLFLDIGATNTATIYDHVSHIVPSMKAPGVPTYCLYGINQPTEFFYHYPTNDFDSDPTVIDYSDLGDGTVPLRSLQECSTWASQQTQPVLVKEFDESDHTDILEDEVLIHFVASIVTGTSA